MQQLERCPRSAVQASEPPTERHPATGRLTSQTAELPSLLPQLQRQRTSYDYCNQDPINCYDLNGAGLIHWLKKHVVDPVIDRTYTVDVGVDIGIGAHVQLSVSKSGYTVAGGVGFGLEADVSVGVSKGDAPSGAYGELQGCALLCRDKVFPHIFTSFFSPASTATSSAVEYRDELGAALGASATINYGYSSRWP